mmetsp:Transcript_80684/g.218511  ORF Transcript_80684/g.218511 Transcript_80684/m.218511 type:complete len:431 (-) Transcript_80684:57-1349(-)
MMPGLVCAAALAALRPALGLQLEGQQVPEAINLEQITTLAGDYEEAEEAEQNRDAAGNCLRFTDPSKSKWNKTTMGMWHIKESHFVQQPPEPLPKPGSKPKVAYLMFVKDRVENPKLWLRWMRDARQSGLDFSLIIHAYGINRPYGRYVPSEFPQKEFLQYVSPHWRPSNWCMMWDAEFLVFKEAFQDPNVTHFITLSADTIPVKPMRYIYQALEDDPVTRMCADDYVYKPWPRAETWWAMRRGDAELFIQHEDQAREKFRCECSEEEAWYYPLRARMERWGREAAPVKNECITLTDWADGNQSCKQWADMVKLCPNNCRVTRSMNKTESATKHPVIFHQLTTPAFKELMASPFWFMRKVDDEAMANPNRFGAMLADYTANYTDPAEGYEENLNIPEEEEDLPDAPPEPEEPAQPQRRQRWWDHLRPHRR